MKTIKTTLEMKSMKKITNITTGEVYERVVKDSMIFANVDDEREMIEIVGAELDNKNNIIYIDTKGEKYKKIS